MVWGGSPRVMDPYHCAPLLRVTCLTEEIGSRCKPHIFEDQSGLIICIILIRFDDDLSWHRRFCCHTHICAGLICSLNPFFPPNPSAFPSQQHAGEQLVGS